MEAELGTINHADTLVIMDTCFSAAVAMGPGNVEYLAASASESQATASVANSFTRRFIDLLKSIDTPDITVAQIHSKLVKGANEPNSKLYHTPVHVATTERPSITLRPTHKIPREVATLNSTGEFADRKVLVSILLEGKTSIPEVEEWKRWLTSTIPNRIADIKVEAVFESHSSLCLMTMPLAVWDMLKQSEAYGFVAYVESHNILLSQPSQPSSSNVLGGRAGNVQLPSRGE